MHATLSIIPWTGRVLLRTGLRIYAGLCLLAAGAGAQTYGTWSYYKTLTFNTTFISGNVTNYPLLVRLTSTNFDFSQAMTNGEDIRFEDPDGTALSYEIERWNAGSE